VTLWGANVRGGNLSEEGADVWTPVVGMRFSECTCRLRLVGCRLSLACDEGAAFATLHYMG